MDNLEILVSYARKLKTNGFVSEGCNKGSISIRNEENIICMSPSKLDYAEMSSNDINLLDLQGTLIQKNAPTSRDSTFHLAVYQARPDVRAIIHTHSRYATALALANKGIPYITYGMKQHCKGKVDIAPFAFPDSPEVNAAIVHYLGDKSAVLIQNHGLVCVGSTMAECYETAAFVEELSESYIHSLCVGTVIEIL